MSSVSATSAAPDPGVRRVLPGRVYSIRASNGAPSPLFSLCWWHLNDHYGWVEAEASRHWSIGSVVEWVDGTWGNPACRECGWGPVLLGEHVPVQPFVGPRSAIHAAHLGYVEVGSEVRSLCSRTVYVSALMDPSEWEPLVRRDVATLKVGDARGCWRCNAAWMRLIGSPRELVVR